tara:strand:- start:65 stop:1129 length:1065 start_codon:yes stop_codon:yes gene_type:complete
MVMETEIKPKDLLVSIHESLFWRDADPYFGSSHSQEGQTIDLSQDSYIWCFTGTRGAGKTTAMTEYAIRCNWTYGMKIISNFPIEYLLVLANGDTVLVKAEELDMYKLLCFDEDYKHCLILIDEAADIVSHLASMSWKNRLLNIFVRQLRKNNNTLFLGSQQFELIDKSLRWQVDIIAECTDASRKKGNRSLRRGECILVYLLDNSGMWTGERWERRQARLGYNKRAALKKKIFPGVLWGDKNKGTKPVYDTYYQQDIWESLRKVDIKLGSFQVGEGTNTLDYFDRAVPPLHEAIAAGRVKKADLHRATGLNDREKDDFSKRIRYAGTEDTGYSHLYYKFENFDWDKFYSYGRE